MKGHSWDFPMYTYLISLNAFDPPLNDWLSECVHHDTDPFQLLRSNRCLPMDRIVGNSIGYVMIHTPHELWYSHLCTSEPLPTIIRSPQQSGVHIYFLVYIFIFKPVVLGKITTSVPHLLDYILPIYMYLEYLNVWIDFIHAILEICIWKWDYLFNQEASKNTTAHWA